MSSPEEPSANPGGRRGIGGVAPTNPGNASSSVAGAVGTDAAAQSREAVRSEERREARSGKRTEHIGTVEAGAEADAKRLLCL